MPYYQGDYYQGDYYQGDIFGTLKGMVKGAVGGFFKGGPVGAISGAAKGAIVRAGKTVPPAPPPLMLPAIAPRMMDIDVPKALPGAVKQPGLGGAIERFLPFGQTGYVPGSQLGMGPPAGWHWNKAFSYAKGLPAGSFLVRNRSMNPLNPRALRRTVRRQRGAVGLMRAVLSGSGYTIKRVGLPGKGKRRARR